MFDINNTTTDSKESTVEIELHGNKAVRWYQLAARNGVEAALEQNPNARVLVHLPTGAGKTITSGLIFSSSRVRKALNIDPNRKLRLLFIAHKHRLLTQAELAYAEAENIEFIPQSVFSDIPDDVLKKGWDIMCLDECQHESCATLQYQLEKLGAKPIIGLTATPDRADGYLIKFDHIVNPISREQAVAEGYLAETELYSFVGTGSKTQVPLVKDIVDQCGDSMDGTMVFMRTKREVAEVTEFLVSKGYSAISITDQSNSEVDRILNAFSAGEYQFVVNCNKISEGVDVVGCSDVIIGRTVGSYPMLNQIIGRAARPDSACRVYEIVNPLSGYNLDTTIVVGTPKVHRLFYKRKGQYVTRDFDTSPVDVAA